MKKVKLLLALFLFAFFCSSCGSSRKGGGWYRNRNNSYQPEKSPMKIEEGICSRNEEIKAG